MADDAQPVDSAGIDEPVDEQSVDPPAELLAVARAVTEPWLRRSIERAAARGRVDTSGWDDLDAVVGAAAELIVGDLGDLLARDVDDQRVNPLSIFRSGVAAPVDYLRQRGVPTPPADRFAAERFPGDPYQLGPATWSDIDPALHEPGLLWGAWKAKVVLDRRREEGKR